MAVAPEAATAYGPGSKDRRAVPSQLGTCPVPGPHGYSWSPTSLPDMGPPIHGGRSQMPLHPSLGPCPSAPGSTPFRRDGASPTQRHLHLSCKRGRWACLPCQSLLVISQSSGGLYKGAQCHPKNRTCPGQAAMSGSLKLPVSFAWGRTGERVVGQGHCRPQGKAAGRQEGCVIGRPPYGYGYDWSLLSPHLALG